MQLAEFLSTNPLPAIGEEGVEAAPGPSDVQLTGRIEAADDRDILVRLGDSVVRLARDDVVEVEDDPGRPLIEPGSVYARLTVRAGAQSRIETVVPVSSLNGAGLRPMVAAQASLAPQYSVRAESFGRPLGGQTAVYQTGRQTVVYPTGMQNWNRQGNGPTPSTTSHTIESTGFQCPISTVQDGVITEDWAEDHIGDTPTDNGDD